VSRVRIAGSAAEDIESLTQFLVENEPAAAVQTPALIVEALAILQRHPLIGRRVESGLRELVISRGKSGYLALYRWAAALDEVRVLAIRHQREAGYRQET
jgi:plasmid stabilization system protein ParE